MALSRRALIALLAGWLTQAGVRLGLAGKRETIKVLDPADAVRAVIPFEEGSAVAKFRHECCGCGLTHYVALVVVEGGVEALWWVDREGTRKARRRLGVPGQGAPYGAEFQRPDGW